MKLTRLRVAVAITVLSGAGIVAGVTASSAQDDGGNNAKVEQLQAIDREQDARDAADGKQTVYDTATGKPVRVDQEEVAEQMRAANSDPALFDKDGNPRFMLVWRDGKLVPGPALKCQPNEKRGEPAICTVVG